MRLLIDTNIIVDILLKREPFFNDSYSALRLAIEKNLECFITATAVTNVFYLVRKGLQSSEQAKDNISKLAQMVSFADVSSSDIITALSSDMSDFESAAVDTIAEKIGAAYTITRNTDDFKNSKVPAITPTTFLQWASNN